MKDLNIYDLAKIIGYDDVAVADLKVKFPNYSPDVKYQVTDILWKSFYDLVKKISNLKLEELKLEVASGKRKLTSDMMVEAKRMTWKEIDEILAGKPQEVNEMEEIRNKLKFLTENVQKGSANNPSINTT